MSAAARRLVLTFALTALPLAAHAQATWQPTQPPLVTAENEPWFRSGDPIIWSGDYYYPSGAPMHFRAYEMVRSGSFRGIPLYTDPTIDPLNVVYVPVAGGLVQPYQLRREGPLAGTTGNTTPAFPPAAATGAARPEVAGVATTEDLREAPGPPMLQRPYEAAAVDRVPAAGATAVGTAGRIAPAPAPAAEGPVETVIEPRGINAVWVMYDGRRWYADGPALDVSEEPFTQVGTYHGFAVYRWNEDPSRIYVATSPGIAAPYSRTRPERKNQQKIRR